MSTNEFKFNKTTQTLKKYLGNEKSIVIPSKIDNVAVTHIGDKAFYSNSLTELHLPDSVTHIGDGAFRFNELNKVYIENTHVTIGKEAFSNNPIESFIIKDLTQEQIMHEAFIYDNEGKNIIGYKGYLGDKIKIPEDITHIGKEVFQYNLLTELHLPDSLTHIGDKAFYYNSLTELHLPDSVTDIGNNAFLSNQITKVYIENTHVTIRERAFSNNPIESFTIKGLTQEQIMHEAFIYDNEGKTIIGYKGYLGDKIKIPEDITHIGDSALGYNSLKELHLPNSVTHIGKLAFRYNSLTKVYIENSHVTIEEGAFSNNPIESFTIKGLTQEQIMHEAFIYDKESKTITGYKGYLGDKIKIPEEITHIGEEAFSSKTLKELHIPNSVTHIGDRGFYSNSLTELHLPDSLIHIGDRAFSINELELVIIGENVKFIGNDAFSSQLNKLQRVIILGDQTRFNDRWSKIGFPYKLKPK
jgi:hypothetical protein